MGPRQTDVLDAAFGVLFKMSLEIPIFLRHRQSFAVNDAIKHALAHSYAEILMVISDATVHCMKQKQGTKSHPYHYQCLTDQSKWVQPRTSTACVAIEWRHSTALENRSLPLFGRITCKTLSICTV